MTIIVEFTLPSDSFPFGRAMSGDETVRCPRCDAPVALVVSHGPLTHNASRCGCRVSGGLLEGNADGD